MTATQATTHFAVTSSPLVTARAATWPAVFYHIRRMRRDLLGYLEELAAQGDFVQIPLGPTKFYYVNHPALVREVMVAQANHFRKPAPVKRLARELFGENVFTSDGEVWRVLHSALVPAFHAARVDACAALITRLAGAMVDAWPARGTVEMIPQLMDLTLGVTTLALFSQDLRDEQAGVAIIRFIELFNRGIASPLPAWIPTPAQREMKQLVQAARAYLQPVIDARRASGEDRGDVLSMLLIAQANDTSGILTDEQVTNEVTNLFAAGYEVVSHTLAFTLYLLARHEAWLEKTIAEVRGQLGTRPATAADLEALPLLDQVVKESMRLLPVTAVVAREAAVDMTLNGATIRRGQTVLIPPWTLHRRAADFPDPLRFDPERFAPARSASIPKFAYIPFATGPRICLGAAFANLQVRLTLAAILQHVRPALLPGYTMRPIFRFNTRPADALPMQIVKEV